MIEVPSSNQDYIGPIFFQSPEDLRSHLDEDEMADAAVSGRIYLLENLSFSYMEVFGSHFKIDPSLFATHIRTANWEGHTAANNTPKLLSCRDSATSFTLRYNEARFFDDVIGHGGRLFDVNAGRQIDITPGLKDFERIGVVRRCASFWSQRIENRWYGKDVVF